MAHDEVRFPEDISYGSAGGPRFNTTVTILASGDEQRNENWEDTKAEYDAQHAIKDLTQMDALINFFRARRGRSRSFRFKDWSDYQLTNQSIGTGDGATTVFQVFKRYSSGGQNFDRPLLKLVSGTVSFTVNGGAPGDHAINHDLGIITFTTPPAVSHDIFITSLEFDVPCRFDMDHMDISQDFFETQSWPSIPIVEVKNPD